MTAGTVVKYICASIRLFLYAAGSHCNVFSCYSIKIVVAVVVYFTGHYCTEGL